MKAEERMKQIDKQILKVSAINAPGTMMFGLGLFAKFSENGAEFYPFLGKPSVVNALIVIGAFVMFWGGYKVFSLSKEKSQLKNLNQS